MKPNGRGVKAAIRVAALVCASIGTTGVAGSPLFDRGYAVLPSPQNVSLGQRDVEFTRDWRVKLDAGVGPAEAAVVSFRGGLAARFGLRLKPAGQDGAPAVSFRFLWSRGRWQLGKRRTATRRHWRSRPTNHPHPGSREDYWQRPGLFYGVQTFLQLLNRRGGGLRFPDGEIQDWPDLQLRVIYWDDAHHLEHLDVLKAALRQAAFFKINGFALKLEGHFEFRTAPAIMEPYVLRAGELRRADGLCAAALHPAHPYLDAPAHDSFILKHPAYSSLRAFPNCNYEFCVVNPGTYDLLFGMFQDLLDANRGGKYFCLSTDEPYYIGMAQGAGCDEAARARELGSASKLLVDFISRAAAYLHERGRTVLFWGEYPLKPEDIGALPSYLVNGETGGPEFDPVFRGRGIRQLIYTSTQGEEPLFPDYDPLPQTERLHNGSGPAEPGRVAEVFRAVSSSEARQQADLMGAFVAGWADAGLHPETFWLGYATGPAAAWHPDSSGPDELKSRFYRLFYGADLPSMGRLYRLLSRQARFWDDSWETAPSQARTPIFGYSHGIFNPPRAAQDQTLPLLPAPAREGLKVDRDWSKENLRRLELARRFLAENQELLGLIGENGRRPAEPLQPRRVSFDRANLPGKLGDAVGYGADQRTVEGRPGAG